MNSEFHSHLKNIFGMKYHTHSQWQLLDLERNTDKCHLNTSGDIAPKIAEVLQCVNPTTFFIVPAEIWELLMKFHLVFFSECNIPEHEGLVL